MCLYNAREGGLRIPVAAFVIVFGPALIMNFIQPADRTFVVKPDELRVERKPYLEPQYRGDPARIQARHG